MLTSLPLEQLVKDLAAIQTAAEEGGALGVVDFASDQGRALDAIVEEEEPPPEPEPEPEPEPAAADAGAAAAADAPPAPSVDDGDRVDPVDSVGASAARTKAASDTAVRNALLDKYKMTTLKGSGLTAEQREARARERDFVTDCNDAVVSAADKVAKEVRCHLSRRARYSPSVNG